MFFEKGEVGAQILLSKSTLGLDWKGDKRSEMRHFLRNLHFTSKSCQISFKYRLFHFYLSRISSHLTSRNLQLTEWLRSSGSKEPACNPGDKRETGSIPGSGRSPGKGNGNPLQYFCLENLMDREDWWATVHGIAKNRIWLSIQHKTFLTSHGKTNSYLCQMIPI